jgi:hypothetical protein
MNMKNGISARDIAGVGDRTQTQKIFSHPMVYDNKKPWIGHINIATASFPFRRTFKSAKQLGPLYAAYKKGKLRDYKKLQAKREEEAVQKYTVTKRATDLPKANLYLSHEFLRFLKTGEGVGGIFCFSNSKGKWIHPETREVNYYRNYAIVTDIASDYPTLLRGLGKERQVEELILLQYPQRIYFDMEREDYKAISSIGALRKYALDGFTKALKDALESCLGLDPADVDINITDASESHKKFSLHVVVVTRCNMVCRDGRDCALIFALLAKHLFVLSRKDKNLREFLYFFDEEKKALDTIFDCSVYGGWQRNMRMIGAYKLGKNGRASRKLTALNNYDKPFTDFVISQLQVTEEDQFFDVTEEMREEAKGLARQHHDDPVTYAKLVKSTYRSNSTTAADLETHWVETSSLDYDQEDFVDHYIGARKIKQFLCLDEDEYEEEHISKVSEEYAILANNHLKSVLLKLHPRADIRSVSRNMNPECSVVTTIGFFPRNESEGPTRMCLFGCSHGSHECKIHIHADLSITYFCHSEKCPSREIRDTCYGVRIVSSPFRKNMLAPVETNSRLDKSFINEFCGKFVDYRERISKSEPGAKVYLEPLTLPKVYPQLEHKLYILHANMGTGKTVAIKSLISDLTTQPELEKTELRILSVCFRQILGNKHADDFGLEFYKDLRKDQANGEVNQLSLQLDSLHKLLVPKQDDNSSFELYMPYDILILDESHSIYKHFNSEPMKKVVNKNYIALYELLMTSKVIIVADADIGKLDLDVLRDTVLRRHEFTRDAVEYHLNPRISTRPKFVEYLYQSTWFNELMDTVFKQNKKVFIVSNIKGETDFIEEEIRTRNSKLPEHQRKKWDYIHGDSKESKKRELADCEKRWQGKDVVLGTPALGAGIDFNKLYFHKIFVFGSSSTLEAEGLNQMRGRVRQTIDQECNIYTTSKSNHSSNNESNALTVFAKLERQLAKQERRGQEFLEQYQGSDFGQKAFHIAKQAILEDPDFASPDLMQTMAKASVHVTGWMNTFVRKIGDEHDENIKNAISFGENNNKPFTRFRRNITLNSFVELKTSRKDFQRAFQRTLQKQDPLVDYRFSEVGDEEQEQKYKRAVAEMRQQKNNINKVGIASQVTLPGDEEIPNTLDELEEIALSQKHDGISVRDDVPGDTDAMLKHNIIKRKFLLSTDDITYPPTANKTDDERTFFRCHAMNLVRDTCNYGDGSNKNDLCTRLLDYVTTTKRELQVYEKVFGRNQELRDPDGNLIIKGDDIASLSPIVVRDYLLKMFYLLGFSLGLEPGPVQQRFDDFCFGHYRAGRLKPPVFEVEDVFDKIVQEFNEKCEQDESYFRDWLSGILGGTSFAHCFACYARLSTQEGKNLFKELRSYNLTDEHKEAKVRKRKYKGKENQHPNKRKKDDNGNSCPEDEYDPAKELAKQNRAAAGTLRKSVETMVGLRLRSSQSDFCQKNELGNGEAPTHIRSHLREKWTTRQRRRECTLYGFGHEKKKKGDKPQYDANKNNLLLELSLLFTLAKMKEALSGKLPETILLDNPLEVAETNGESSVSKNMVRNKAARLCQVFTRNPETLRRDYLKYYSSVHLPDLDIDREVLSQVVGPNQESQALMYLEKMKENEKELSYLFCKTVAERKLESNKAVNINYTKQARKAKLEEKVIEQIKGYLKACDPKNAKTKERVKEMNKRLEIFKKKRCAARIEAKRNRFKELSCTDPFEDPKTFCQQVCHQPGYKRVLDLSFGRHPKGFLRKIDIEYKNFNCTS